MATKSTPQFTKEEIAVERNRRKCLNYQQTHREAYRKYQREYAAANRNELKNVRYRLVLRIRKLEATLDQLRPQLEAMDAELAKRSVEENTELASKVDQIKANDPLNQVNT